MKVHSYTVPIEPSEEGGYWSRVPALPGCFSQGETIEKTITNTKEAIELYLEDSPQVLEYGDETAEKQFLIPIQVSYA